MFWACSLFGQSPLSPTNITWLPKQNYSLGAGFVSPNGKFSYLAESTFIGAGTYSTVTIEDTVLKGQVASCTLAGISKPLYQFSFVTAGLTGLGGGCTSTAGNASAVGAGQAFADFRFKKSAWGVTITAMKETSGGYKVTGGIRWAQ